MMRLEVSGLVRSFGKKRVLDGIDMAFSTGRIYGLFGRNGVGKSTLFRCICDQLPFEEGSVTVDGEDVRKRKAPLATILAGEDNLLPSDMKVKDIVSAFAALRAVDADRIMADLGKWGVETARKWERLSTGQRTMLKNALALGSRAPFIFLDEPVLGLDAVNREALYTRILESAGEDVCLVISSHIIDELAVLASDIIFLDKGKVCLAEERDELEAKAMLLSGPSASLDAVKGDFRVVSRGERLSVPYMCILGTVTEAGDDIRVERADVQQLFVEIAGR